jgi:hypothetical protein
MRSAAASSPLIKPNVRPGRPPEGSASRLAERADKVIRLVCGIPSVIKE